MLEVDTVIQLPVSMERQNASVDMLLSSINVSIENDKDKVEMERLRERKYRPLCTKKERMKVDKAVNAMKERMRCRLQNDAFLRLRQKLPWALKKSKSYSKLAIVNQTVAYIDFLTDALYDHEQTLQQITDSALASNPLRCIGLKNSLKDHTEEKLNQFRAEYSIENKKIDWTI